MTGEPIRFLKLWRGREPGHIDAGLDYGVRQILVERRIAEWCGGPKASASTATVAAPALAPPTDATLWPRPATTPRRTSLARPSVPVSEIVGKNSVRATPTFAFAATE